MIKVLDNTLGLTAGLLGPWLDHKEQLSDVFVLLRLALGAVLSGARLPNGQWGFLEVLR